MIYYLFVDLFISMLLEHSSLESYLKVQMETIFFPPMIDEWIGTHLQPIRNKLLELKLTVENQIKINSRR